MQPKPLTPALSLREREKLPPQVGEADMSGRMLPPKARRTNAAVYATLASDSQKSVGTLSLSLGERERVRGGLDELSSGQFNRATLDLPGCASDLLIRLCPALSRPRSAK